MTRRQDRRTAARRLALWWAVGVIALAVTPVRAEAQLDRQTRERIESFERGVEFAAWETLASSACRMASTGDAVADARAYLQRLTRAIPSATGPRIRSRDRLVQRRGVSLDFVELTGRIPGTEVRVLLGEPERVDPSAPTVLLIAGPGVLAHQAFGVRLAGDDSLIVFPEAPLFWGAAQEFLDAGMRVVALEVSDDVRRWPNFPWQDLARRATIMRRRDPDMTLATPAFAHVLTALDFAASLTPNGVVAGGWSDAATFASLLGPDPRVRAVMRLAPPIDRPTLRRSALGVRTGPAILADDCGLSDVALARLAAPKPLLITWSTGVADSLSGQPPAAPGVADSIAAIYASLGAPNAFRSAPRAPRDEWRGSMHAWLATQGVPAGRRVAGTTAAPRRSPVAPLPVRRIIDQTFTNNRIAVGPGCTQRSVRVGRASRERHDAAVDSLRLELRTRLGVRAGVTRKRWRIDTVGVSPAFVVIAYAEAERADGPRGFAAIPRSGTERSPLVVSYNGDDGTIPLLDRRHRAPTEYLNAAGAVLAERGYVVLIPSVASWFPDGGGAVLEARTGDALAAWSRIMSDYVDGLSFALDRLPVDSASVIGYGISFGGEALLLHAAVDLRIRQVLYNNPTSRPAAFFAHPDAAVLATWQNAICEYETAIRTSLVAPRPFLWENGLFDTNALDEDPLDAVAEVRAVYESLAAADRFFFIRHGGGHATRLNASLLDLLSP